MLNTFVRFEIVCDHCHKREVVEGKSHGELLRKLRDTGWDVQVMRNGNVVDLCPDCVERNHPLDPEPDPLIA